MTIYRHGFLLSYVSDPQYHIAAYASERGLKWNSLNWRVIRNLKTRQITNLKKFLRFPGPQPRKPQKRHDLETYVSFPGNLLKRTFMYIFSITKIVSRFPNSKFPGYYPGRKPGDLQKCPETIWSSWRRGNTRAIHASCCATASWLWAEWTVEELELGSLTRRLSHGGRTSSNHLTLLLFTCSHVR